MNSIWAETEKLPGFPTLEGSVKTDVLIIGGGIAGILCAYFLQEKEIDYLLVEKNVICSGITQNTTAKITSQHGLIYDKLCKSAGLETARKYLEANQKSARKYLEMSKTIECDMEIKPSYVYSINDREKLEKEADALRKLGFSADITETTELPFLTVGAIRFDNQAQFHPLRFLSKISENLRIYENTFVKELSDHEAITEKGTIAFNKLIIATHFPMDNRHGMYFLKMYQHRSYVIALEHAAQIQGMYVDEAQCGMSFRNYKDFLLVGGGDHRTGERGGGWQELRAFSEKYYPSACEKYAWATQDCMTLDGVPYIGKYAKKRAEWYVATGFNKWGITSSMTAALILTDLVLERENPYVEVFSPSRSMMNLQLLSNSWKAMINLLTPSKKRCPHLGCALKWNSLEHTWDCPCHGSRFNIEGKNLTNPANGDLEKCPLPPGQELFQK
ncbi:MAG: FAD-dependent oxidoreductase [Oliverpabstia sp.]